MIKTSYKLESKKDFPNRNGNGMRIKAQFCIFKKDVKIDDNAYSSGPKHQDSSYLKQLKHFNLHMMAFMMVMWN